MNDLEREAWSRGFSAGDYGNAYESQDWYSWFSDRCIVPTEFVAVQRVYCDALLLGFFGSYETHEIEDETLAETVYTLRKEYGR